MTRFLTQEEIERGREVCAEDTCSELVGRNATTPFCRSHANRWRGYLGRRPFIGKPETRSREQRERDAAAEVLRALRLWREGLGPWQVEPIVLRHHAEEAAVLALLKRWAFRRSEEAAPLYGRGPSGASVMRLRLRGTR